MNLELNNYRYPFVDSPFYKSLKEKNFNKKYTKLCDELNENGYCILDFNIPEDLIDQANIDIKKSNNSFVSCFKGCFYLMRLKPPSWFGIVLDPQKYENCNKYH